jgi:hypothetical protein
MALSLSQIDFRTRKLYDMGLLVGADEMIVSRVLIQGTENPGKRFIIVLKLKFQGRLPHKMLQHVLNSIPLKRECNETT